ncbi:MAG: SufE family protein, partial [Acidimicrobiia bacterium]|nr:SufE family protein [Acidimicrobiia bacterium]
LQKFVALFDGVPKRMRVEALLDYSKRLPPLPEGIESKVEQVHECQTPFFLHTEINEDGRVRLYFDAPQESPTVRGYAEILREGLDGETPEAILGVPNDFYYGIGLEDVVTPQRLRGMGAILARVKRHVRDQVTD